MPDVLIKGPPFKYLDGCLKLPSAKDAIFAELLPREAVRHAADNTTLYSVVYQRLKKTPKQNIGGPLIVTLYQSHLRAKKFRTLVKMKVNVRLEKGESHRYGVAVAVDEVAECVYVAYTRDEQTRSVKQRRLLLRQVKLTLAAADARGVRRLQRPSSGRPSSVTFEAKNYCKRAAVASSAYQHAKRNAETRMAVQQLVLDGATLLLYLRIGHGLSYRGSFELTEVTSAVALLKLRKKSGSMDVRMRAPIGASLAVRGAGQQHEFLAVGSTQTRRGRRLPYSQMPMLLKMGTVESAVFQQLIDALGFELETLPSTDQRHLRGFISLGSLGRWHIYNETYGDDDVKVIVTTYNMGSVLQTTITAMQMVEFFGALDEWSSRHPTVGSVEEGAVFRTDGACLLVVAYARQGTPSARSAIVLRANLRSLLPPKSACANCRSAIRPSPPEKKQVCKVCQMRGFSKFSLVFGCHFCSAACLRDAWPKHSLLHHTPPLKDWTDADWKRWEDNRPNQ